MALPFDLDEAVGADFDDRAWRERQCLIKLLDALDGATLHETRGYYDFQRYRAGDVVMAFRSILKDFDEGRFP